MFQLRESDGWDLCRRVVRQPLATLTASELHAPLARPGVRLMAQWDVLDVERRAADDAVDANARVSWLNVRLDAVLGGFIAQVLADCGGKREHKTFAGIFPDAPGELVRLGLQSEVEALRALAPKVDAAALSKTRAGATVGGDRAFLAADSGQGRRRDEAALGDHPLWAREPERWKDDANGVLRFRRRGPGVPRRGERGLRLELQRGLLLASRPARTAPRPTRAMGGGSATCGVIRVGQGHQLPVATDSPPRSAPEVSGLAPAAPVDLEPRDPRRRAARDRALDLQRVAEPQVHPAELPRRRSPPCAPGATETARPPLRLEHGLQRGALVAHQRRRRGDPRALHRCGTRRSAHSWPELAGGHLPVPGRT